MSKLHLLLVVIGMLISFYGLYSLIFEGDSSAFIFTFGGIVIASIGAGLIGKAHKKDMNDAG